MNLVQSYRCLDQNRISNQFAWICSVLILVIQAILCTSIVSSLSIDRSIIIYTTFTDDPFESSCLRPLLGVRAEMYPWEARNRDAFINIYMFLLILVEMVLILVELSTF